MEILPLVFAVVLEILVSDVNPSTNLPVESLDSDIEDDGFDALAYCCRAVHPLAVLSDRTYPLR